MVRGYPKALSRRTDPRTSKAAAGSFDGKDLETISGRVLKAVADAGTRGATAEEVSNAIRLSKQTVTPRIRPLVNEAKLRDSGETRENRSGRAAIVWRYVPEEEREGILAEREAAEPEYMTAGKLRGLLARVPADAKVQVVSPEGENRHRVFVVVAAKRGDQFARDNRYGSPNGRGPYELLALDDTEVILEADEVGEWDDDV